MQSNLENFKILLPYIKPHFWKILTVLLLIPFGSFTFSIQPILIQKAIDGPIMAGDFTQLWSLTFYFTLAVILNFAIQVVQFWLMSEVGQSVVASARYDLFRHLESLSLSFFDRTPVGRSVSRITSDMEQLAESFSGGLILIILDIFNILGILIFMFYLNSKLAAVLSFFLIPVYLLNSYYQKIFRESNLIARKELSKLNSFLQQNIVGISVVQALNSAAKSMSKFAQYNQSYFEANDENIKADSQLSAFTELVSFIAIAFLILIGMLIIKSGTAILTIGMLVAFVQYAQSLFEPIRNLSDRFTIVQSAFTSLERINELKAERVEIEDPSDAQFDVIASPLKTGVAISRAEERDHHVALRAPRDDISIPLPLIEFKNVYFKYQTLKDEDDVVIPTSENTDDEWVLKGLSFSIAQGQKVAFIGKTGSGKSTIIKLLTRLYDPQAGEILLNGINIKNFKQDDLRKHIGVIHQDSYIFAGDLTDNIKLNRDEAKLNMHLIDPILKTTKLDKNKDLSERATNISSGEQQVINFARVLVGDPEILILDEATAKIDANTESKLHEILAEFLSEKKTAIFIAHRLETIESCDLVYRLDQGVVK